MSLPKFVIGLIFTVSIVAIWSCLDAVPVGTVLLRMAACAVILQLGYFLIVLAMVARSKPGPAKLHDKRKTSKADHSAEADEFNGKRTLR